MSEYEYGELGLAPVASVSAAENDGDDEDEVLEGYDRFREDCRPSYVDESAGEAFYDNQPWYFDTVEPSEFWDDFNEAYAGQFSSDQDFAQDLSEQMGDEIPDTWPQRYIDWEQAARELMYDYFESGGYYFRNI